MAWRKVLYFFNIVKEKKTPEQDITEMVDRLLRLRRQRDELDRSIEDMEKQLKRSGVTIDPQEPKLF